MSAGAPPPKAKNIYIYNKIYIHPTSAQLTTLDAERGHVLMQTCGRRMREKVAWLIERAQLNEETSRMRRAMEMSERIRQQREGGSEAGRANEALLLLRMKSELQGLQEECAKAARAEVCACAYNLCFA